MVTEILKLLFAEDDLNPPVQGVRVVANRATGLRWLNQRGLSAHLRGQVAEGADGVPLGIYLQGLRGAPWELQDDFDFQTSRRRIEERLGRRLYFEERDDQDVLSAVASDPGGIGLVRRGTRLPAGVVEVYRA